MRQVLDALEADLDRLPPGAKLPSEHDLMNRFGATRSTVRRAIEQLEARYLVRRVHGSGTFINSRVDYLISSGLAPSLHATLQHAGIEARTFLIGSVTEPVPADIAARLDIAPDSPCTRLTRMSYIDDEPATCAEEWLAPGVLDHADVSLRAIESLAEVLRGSRRDPVRAWSRVSTEFPSARVAKRLALRAPAPVWHLETQTRDGAAGTPLLFSRSWMRQDRIRVVIEFDGSAPAGTGPSLPAA